jgi:ankyrin repeat protein
LVPDEQSLFGAAVMKFILVFVITIFGSLKFAYAQIPPSANQIAQYDGLLKAAHEGDVARVMALISDGADLKQTDGNKRSAVHVAAFASHEDVIAALAEAGADINALDSDAYDAVTIAAIANDVSMLKAALAAGNRADNITSRYIGTALIAAAHLGHHEVVKILIDADAPLDHVNNLNWTAMIEAVVLGDGGTNHQMTLQHLIDAGADASITDASGRTPLDLARQRGYAEMVKMLGG